MFRSDFETAPGDEADPPGVHFPFNLFCLEDPKAYWRREAYRELIQLLDRSIDQIRNLLLSKYTMDTSAYPIALQQARSAAYLVEMLISLLGEQLQESSREAQ